MIGLSEINLNFVEERERRILAMRYLNLLLYFSYLQQNIEITDLFTFSIILNNMVRDK